MENSFTGIPMQCKDSKHNKFYQYILCLIFFEAFCYNKRLYNNQKPNYSIKYLLNSEYKIKFGQTLHII